MRIETFDSKHNGHRFAAVITVATCGLILHLVAGGRCLVNARWPVAGGQWSVAGAWPVVGGRFSVDGGRLPVVGGRKKCN